MNRSSLFGRMALVAMLAGAGVTMACGRVSLGAVQAPGGAGTAGATAGAGGTGVAVGGSTGTGGVASGAAGCGGRLTPTEATSLYTTYAFAVQPNLSPMTVFELTELEVPGLWDGLGAQLFHVTSPSGFRECTTLTHACQVIVPAGECSQSVYPLSSGLVANGAFYFSWGFGSGVVRSQIGKLTRDGAQWKRVVSAAYMNANSGGPLLVLQASGKDVRVFRAWAKPFNQWSSAEPIGKLDDRGDSLFIVDDAGQPISSPLP